MFLRILMGSRALFWKAWSPSPQPLSHEGRGAIDQRLTVTDVLTLVGKSVLIAIAAALAAWLYLLGFAGISGGELSTRGYVGVMLYGSLAGSFGLGLPIALMVYWMASHHLAQSPKLLAMIALLAGIMMILASYVIGQEEGVVLLGMPAFFAALTFGGLGWLWIVKPIRNGLV